MRCPYCHQTEDRVVDTRASREGRAIRRRRECVNCTRRFTTYEYVMERQVQLAKRDGSTEPFDRQKLMRSIQLPCAKRPVSMAQIEGIVDEIEDELSQRGRDDVESRLVGEMVMDRLRALDHVAYVRFASVYRDFQDVGDFAEEVRDLSEREARAAAGRTQVELPLNP